MAKTLAGVLAVSIAALLFAGCNSTGNGSAAVTVSTTAMATTTTTPKFEKEITGCDTDDLGIVTASGWVRNDSSREQSYSIEFEINDLNDVRLSKRDGSVNNVRAGQTARWQVLGYTDYEGQYKCSVRIKPK
jgi:hypothetical protein